jgi:hypothetical protein
MYGIDDLSKKTNGHHSLLDIYLWCSLSGLYKVYQPYFKYMLTPSSSRRMQRFCDLDTSRPLFTTLEFPVMTREIEMSEDHFGIEYMQIEVTYTVPMHSRINTQSRDFDAMDIDIIKVN